MIGGFSSSYRPWECQPQRPHLPPSSLVIQHSPKTCCMLWLPKFRWKYRSRTQTKYNGFNPAVHILTMPHIIHLLEDAGAHLWQGVSALTAIDVRWNQSCFFLSRAKNCYGTSLNQLCPGLPPWICRSTNAHCIFQKSLHHFKCYNKGRY